MRRDQQGASRRLVAATRLDSYEAVFDDVHPANSIAAPDFIQQIDKRNRIEPHSIYANGNAFLEFDLHLLFAIGSCLRRFRDLPGAGEWRIGGILQFPALMADVPQITVAAVDLF